MARAAKRRRLVRVVRVSAHRPAPLPPRQRLPVAQMCDAWVNDWVSYRGTLITAVVALCVAVALAVALGIQDANQRAFNDAPFCTSSSTTDCKTEFEAMVESKGAPNPPPGRNPPQTYELGLSGPAPADGEVLLPDASPLWHAAGVGDEVTAIVWHGAVVRLVDGAVTGDTASAPAVNVTFLGSVLAAAVAWSVALAVIGVRIREVKRGRRQGWSRRLVPWIGPAETALVGFPVGVVFGFAFDSFLAALFTGLGCTAAITVYQLFDPRRRA